MVLVNKLKKGDRVLVEAVVDDPEEGVVTMKMVQSASEVRPRVADVYRHLGVPVADLLEELDLWEELFGAELRGMCEGWRGKTGKRLLQLIKVREAARRPRFKPGQEVWVRFDDAYPIARSEDICPVGE